MTKKFLVLAASAALTMVACTDKSDSGDSGAADGTDGADGGDGADGTGGAWEGSTFSGQLDTYNGDSLIDQYAISGTGVGCSGCDLAFSGDFTGSVSNFSRTVEWVGGLVYADSDYWGYGGVYGDGSAYIDSYGAATAYGYYGLVYYY